MPTQRRFNPNDHSTLYFTVSDTKMGEWYNLFSHIDPFERIGPIQWIFEQSFRTIREDPDFLFRVLHYHDHFETNVIVACLKDCYYRPEDSVLTLEKEARLTPYPSLMRRWSFPITFGYHRYPIKPGQFPHLP